MLKQKSNVIHVNPRFFHMVSTQFATKIKQFRSDNANELEFEEFFPQHGVLHQFSCVETSSTKFCC